MTASDPVLDFVVEILNDIKTDDRIIAAGTQLGSLDFDSLCLVILINEVQERFGLGCRFQTKLENDFIDIRELTAAQVAEVASSVLEVEAVS
jgi:acyl carrier protein